MSTNGDATIGSLVGGNPSVGAFYARELPAGRLRIGSIVALPVTSTSYPVQQAHDNAGYAWSHDRAWLWLPGNLSVLPSIRISNLERQGFGYATALTVGYAFRVAGSFVGNALVGNLSQEIAYRTGVFRVGLRARLAKSSGEPKLSVLPFIGADFGGGYFDIGYNVDLDNPFGIPRDDGYWSAQLRGGARF